MVVVEVLGLELGLSCAMLVEHFGPGVALQYYGGLAGVPVLGSELGLPCATVG